MRKLILITRSRDKNINSNLSSNFVISTVYPIEMTTKNINTITTVKTSSYTTTISGSNGSVVG